MTVHRTLGGSWAECSDLTCELKFHLPDLTVAEAEQMPMSMLLRLLEVIDPPAIVGASGVKMWSSGLKTNGGHIIHRDYDLPAAIGPDGSLEWRKDGLRHREQDQPAQIWPSGTKAWYRDDHLHRDNGLPAIVWGSGRLEYWVNGLRVEAPA